MPAIVLFAVWKNFGYNMIIILAGPADDPGGTPRGRADRRRQRVAAAPPRHPARRSRRVLLVVSILTMAGYFQLFAEPYVMTQGGPAQSTVSILYFMYEQGFKWWNLGFASAVAFVLFAIMFALTMLQLRVSERWTR